METHGLINKSIVKSAMREDYVGGAHVVYRTENGRGLSLVNSPMLHSYAFAWEAAVLTDVSEDGGKFHLDYDTSLTDDVEVFSTLEQTNEFIERALDILSSLD